MAISLKKVKKAATLLMLLKFCADKFEENLLKQVISKHTVSPAGLEVLPLWAASGVGRPRPRLYKGWAAWNTISLQLDADRVRRLVTHGRQHVSL